MPPSVCMLVIILLTIFVEEGLSKGGRGGGRGGGRSSYGGGGGSGSLGSSGISDVPGSTTAIIWGTVAGGVVAAFLLCLIVSCIRKYACGKRDAGPSYKAHGLPIFNVRDAHQPVPKPGILKNAQKADNTSSTNSRQTKTESTLESVRPPPSYCTVDRCPPPTYSTTNEEVLMYIPRETETNQHSGSKVRHMQLSTTGKDVYVDTRKHKLSSKKPSRSFMI